MEDKWRTSDDELQEIFKNEILLLISGEPVKGKEFKEEERINLLYSWYNKLSDFVDEVKGEVKAGRADGYEDTGCIEKANEILSQIERKVEILEKVPSKRTMDEVLYNF